MIDISSISILPSATAFDALNVIEKGSAKIALVVDEQGALLGTLTDGDIRRALLIGKTLDSSSIDLMNKNFRFARIGFDRSTLLDQMRNEGLSHIPILCDKGRITELVLLRELIETKIISNPVVIMAGGKGTRLRPYTENCPKPMLHVDGKPMLEILLEHCMKSGFRKFYFSVNYLKEQIINYFGDGRAWNADIQYLLEDKPLGTAGSLNFLKSKVEESIVVMNGDVLTKFNLEHLLSFHAQHSADATLCVREYEVNIPFGVVHTKGIELEQFMEKPSYRYLVNAGVYIIKPSLLELIPSGEFVDMPSFLEQAKQAGNRIAVCPIHEYWLDVGRPESLQEAHSSWVVS